MENRSGYYKKNLSGDLAYESFCPSPLPPSPNVDLNQDGIKLLIESNKMIALLNGLSARIPNMDLFVSMYVRKEALMSSQIEGTQCTLDDILSPEVEKNINLDVSDVINYIKATDFAIKSLDTLPLCNRLIRDIHAVLMNNVRGQDKNPGEFRNSQNWIGGAGSTIKNARYIPPNPDDMKAAIADLEQYMNSADEQDPLIRAALIHYQFETIHPFLDGNGRIGRLLITLFLMEKKLLTTPALYISYYLKLNRVEYYDRMSEVRRTGNYEQWVIFFLQAFHESARDAIDTIDRLSALHDENLRKLDDLSKRQKDTAIKLFLYIESNPIINLGNTAKHLEIAYNTAAKTVNVLIEKGILSKGAKLGKTRTYIYEAYLEILRKDT